MQMSKISKTYIEFRALPQYNIVNEGPIMHNKEARALRPWRRSSAQNEGPQKAFQKRPGAVVG